MIYVLLSLSALALTLLILRSYLGVLQKCLRKAKIFNASYAATDVAVPDANKFQEYQQAPGPMPWPILGNLAMLGNKAPFEAFTDLTKIYGDIYTLTLGTTRCLIVNNLELIREVLNQNGKFFGGRPDFLRYHKLFGGDRNNSLALCDWSNLQQKRRNLARRHCSPRDSSSYFTKMSNVGCCEASLLMDRLQEELRPGEPFHIKPLIQQTCANMFSQYMCSVRFSYDDAEFQQIVEYFDEIFWEINQGYAVDFLPWLAPFYNRHVDKIVKWSSTIRKFILERVINEREQNLDIEENEKDFTDALLRSLAEDKNVSRETIIFMLEDFIGGHSAVGNLVMLALTYIAKNPEIAAKIQQETDGICQREQRKINLYDMDKMPYTVATIFEVLRYSSSPIVPHVATEDVAIGGYGVTEGTIVFINNFRLNTGEEYWTKPEQFDPQRFLETVVKPNHNNNCKTLSTASKTVHSKRRNSEGSDSGVEFEKEIASFANHNSSSEGSLPNYGNLESNEAKQSSAETEEKFQVKKNIPHFLPFSIGKRTCIGQNLVRGFGFVLLANIIHAYDVGSKDFGSIKINPACVALPAKTFPLVFTPRCKPN